MRKKIFSNPPPAGATHERYERARREIISAFSGIPEISGLYEYGSVSTPGVSDIDVMVVFRSDLISSRPQDYDIAPDRFPVLSSLPRGTLMLMPQNSFRRIHWLDEHIMLRLLAGEETPLEEIPASMARPRFLASIVDWLPERIAMLIRLIRGDIVDIIFCLRVLRSYAVTLKSVARLTGNGSYADFYNRIKELRDNWRPGRESELVALTEQGCALGFQALAEVSNIAFTNEETAEGTLSLFSDVKFQFIDDPRQWTAERSLVASSDTRIVVHVPATFEPHFSYYSRLPGLLAEQMRLQAHLPLREPRDAAYRTYLSTKMGLATKCADFLLQNGFSDGLFRFGFYFKNYLQNEKARSGLNS